MQPQYPQYQQQNYDFIMNPAQPPKRNLFGTGGNSMAMRILVVVGGLFVLIIIASVFMSLLNHNGSFDKASMLSVAQDQTEIMRVATTGTEDSTDQTNKNFSATASMGLQSDQTSLLTYLQSQGYKPNAKALALKQSATTDTSLDSAKSASTFDPVYKSLMQQELETYRQDLSTAFKSTKGAKGKGILQTNYQHAGLLLTQLTGSAE